jgi:Tol biopolymer transport system component
MKYLQKSHSGDRNHNMTVVLFTLLCVLICGSLALSPKAQTKTSDEQQRVTPKTVPGRNGKIAFSSYRDGNFDIYTTEADGSNVQRLTNNPASDSSPKWSPDGTKIAFISNRDGNPTPDIYVMNADGTNQTRTNNPVIEDDLDWSPDSTRIVFGSIGSISVMNADGSNVQRLTNYPGYDWSPKWSPDGTKIAFVRGDDYIDQGLNISVMNADGTNQTRFSGQPGFDPRWSPDGTKIVFVSGDIFDYSSREIYVINADGSNVQRLTNNPTGEADPRWSPDGTKIAFVRRRVGTPQCPSGAFCSNEIYVMNANGTNQTRLTDSPAGDFSPIFSPDSTKIAFISHRDGNSEIYVMNADGSNQTRLTNSTAEVYNSQLDWQALSLTSPSCPNPIDCAEFFVRQHYRDFLNREPDAGGLAYWTDQITQCGSDALCVHNRRIDVSADFFLSLEFQQTGSFVYGLYKGALGRQPTYPEFTADHNRVIGGTDLEAEKAALANDFVQRPEFLQHYPGSMTNTQFVNTLFDTAGLFPFTAERQAEIDAMNNLGRTRAQVLRNVIDIQAFKDREFNPSFVLMQYFGYMRRDIDQGGYAYWLDVLNRTNNHRGMVCNFINSWEYQLRFGAVTRINADCGQ